MSWLKNSWKKITLAVIGIVGAAVANNNPALAPVIQKGIDAILGALGILGVTNSGKSAALVAAVIAVLLDRARLARRPLAAKTA